jgi:hypothetical protein
VREDVVVQAVNAAASNANTFAKQQEVFLASMSMATGSLAQSLKDVQQVGAVREDRYLALLEENGKLRTELAAEKHKNADVEDRAKQREAEIKVKELELKGKAEQFGQLMRIVQPFLGAASQVGVGLLMSKMGLGGMGVPPPPGAEGLPPPEVSQTPPEVSQAPPEVPGVPRIAVSTAHVAEWRQMFCQCLASMSDATAADLRSRILILFALAQQSPEWGPLLERMRADAGQEALQALFAFTVAANHQGAAAAVS